MVSPLDSVSIRVLPWARLGTSVWSCSRTGVPRGGLTSPLWLLGGSWHIVDKDLVTSKSGILEAPWYQDGASLWALQLVQGPLEPALPQSFSKGLSQTTAPLLS